MFSVSLFYPLTPFYISNTDKLQIYFVDNIINNMRKIKTKQMYKQNIKKFIVMDINEYLDEKYEILCGCNCVICNPYYGDFFEYFILQDEWIYKNTAFEM